MSLQFVFGPSGSGKSKYLQETLVNASLRSPKKKFLLVVPDQYNMQTQKKMILLHPDRAFSNIEVLSFSRLSHRVLEEVGGEEIPVLDDTGKSLIIRLVANNLREKLPFIGGRLDKIGYIHEVKSAISEFMQYAITPDKVSELSKYSASRPSLANKLSDIEQIYREFLKFKEDNYITKEETLDIVRRSLHNSELIKGACIVFDGFTGFTPIQERVIQELLVVADEVTISLDLDDKDNPYVLDGEQELFLLSKKTVASIKKLADEASVIEKEPIYIGRNSLGDSRNPEIAHLEKNIFRFPYKVFSESVSNIHLYHAANMRDEVIDTCQRIRYLTDVKKLQYRDIAVVCGDLGGYADYFIETSALFNIPTFMDYSRSLTSSAFIEALLSALDVLSFDFSLESVMRYLRCGFSPLDREECDELENFLLRTGIRGYKAYCNTWSVNKKDKTDSDKELEKIVHKNERINKYRQMIIDHFEPLMGLSEKSNVEEMCRAFYVFMSNAKMQQKLLKRTEKLSSEGDVVRASEFKQIYAKVMDLLDQIVALIGTQVVTLSEFRDICEAGFAEIKLGTIPQESDTVIVTDMERSRLSDVKTLLFLGVNDANIPGNVSGGGIISDIDRDFLSGTEIVLAPSPKEQIYIQRLYLYMLLSKPEEEIYLSYSAVDGSGKSIRPAYIIDLVKKLFPKLIDEPSYVTHMYGNKIMPASKEMTKEVYAGLMRAYSRGELTDEEKEEAINIGQLMSLLDMEEIRRQIENVAFEQFQISTLPNAVVDSLYGRILQTSISRLEKFASCAYAHFLSYGMALKDREEFGFEKNDMGDVYHKVLEQFSNKLTEQNLAWNDYSEEFSHKLVDELLESIASTYGDTVLVSSARRNALTKRMNRILKRTVDTLQYQLKQGDFIPDAFEQIFSQKREMTDSDGQKIKINVNGKVDRIDLLEKDGRLYIKIIDYKSGNKDFDLTSVYHGLQLQLSIYMKQAMNFEKKTHGNLETYPAGMLYYHIADPIVDVEEELSDEDRTAAILKQLKMKGVVNSDRVNIGLIDHALAGSGSANSDIIPVSITSKDELSSKSNVLSSDDFEVVVNFADKKLEDIVKKIYSGDVSAIPCNMEGGYSPCKYCDYKSICKIDSGINGYEEKTYPKEDKDTILEKMKNGIYE